MAAAFVLAMAGQLVLRLWIWPSLPAWQAQAWAAVEPALGAQGLSLTSDPLVADWEGWFTPRISLGNVRITDTAGEVVLSADSVQATLGLQSVAMLWRLQPIFSELRLSSPRLVAEQLEPGVFRIAGFRFSAADSGNFTLANWILRQGSIQFEQGNLIWHDRVRGKTAEFRDLSLQAENLAYQHRWSMKATPPESLGAPFLFEGDFRHVLLGSPGNLADWVGEALIQFDRVSLAELFGFVHLPADVPLLVSDGQGAMRARLTVDRGTIEDFKVDLDLLNAQVSWGKAPVPLLLNQLKGQLQAKVAARDQMIRVSGLTIQSTQIPEPASIEKAELRISQQPDTADRLVSLTVDSLDLGSAAWLSSHLPLPTIWKQRLVKWAPRGRLDQLDLSWRESAAGIAGFEVSTSFHQLTVLPDEARPGFTALTGKLAATDKGGSLSLDSASSALIFPQVFAEPVLVFDSLVAQVSWSSRHLLSLESGGTSAPTPMAPELMFQIKRLAAQNADLKLSASGGYDWRGEKLGVADLKISVDRVRPERIFRYVPSEISIDTRDWLRDALRPGRPFSGVVELVGELSDFPFRDPSKGRFLVKAKADNAMLEPAAGWPLISGIQADAEFDRQRFRLVAKSGAKLNGLTLSETRVGIDDLEADRPILSVNGVLSGDLARLIDATNRSPLSAMLGHATREFTGSGAAKLDLAMRLDLDNTSRSTLAGRLGVTRATLQPDASLPAATAVTGELAFSESGVKSIGLWGQMLGGEVKMTGSAPNASRTTVSLQGNATGPGLEEWVKQSLGTSIKGTLSGVTPYTAQIDLQGKTVEARIRASLLGLQSDLPRPFKKQATENWGLALDFFQGEGKTADQPGPQRWMITSNQQQISARIHRSPARGRETVIDLDSATVAGALTWIPAPVGVSPAASATARQAKLSGTLQARLSRLWIESADNQESSAATSPQNDGLAQDWPNVEAVAEDFRVGERRWGRLEVQASPSAASRSWDIKRFSIANPDAVLSGRGQWAMLSGTTKTGWRSRTLLNVDLDIKNGGQLLTRSGYPGLVRGAEGKIEGNLNWPGPPTKFSGAMLSGSLKMNLQQGQFLKAEPGIARLLGVVNLQSLPRRIKLDFRDVFSEGFAFERIRGDLQFINGQASTQNLRILGSQASVMLEGSADVGSETQDLRVLVLPEFNAGLASLGYAALANPAIGLGTFLAQFILRNPVRELLSYEYRITGSWSDPVVDPVKREMKSDTTEMKAPEQ